MGGPGYDSRAIIINTLIRVELVIVKKNRHTVRIWRTRHYKEARHAIEVRNNSKHLYCKASTGINFTASEHIGTVRYLACKYVISET